MAQVTRLLEVTRASRRVSTTVALFALSLVANFLCRNLRWRWAYWLVTLAVYGTNTHATLIVARYSRRAARTPAVQSRSSAPDSSAAPLLLLCCS